MLNAAVQLPNYHERHFIYHNIPIVDSDYVSIFEYLAGGRVRRVGACVSYGRAQQCTCVHVRLCLSYALCIIHTFRALASTST